MESRSTIGRHFLQGNFLRLMPSEQKAYAISYFFTPTIFRRVAAFAASVE